MTINQRNNPQSSPHRLTALNRGWRKRCPHCGVGHIFDDWYSIREKCSECELSFEPAEGDTWAFMYLTTGGLTGLIIVAMIIIHPPVFWVGQTIVAVLAVLTIVLTLPRRKGVAIALDYLTRRDKTEAIK